MHEKCRNPKTPRFHRVAAFIVVLAMVALMLFSASYLTTETNHHCTGEHCLICACLQLCENILRQMGTGTSVLAFPVLLAAFFILPLPSQKVPVSQSTLTAQKVRLNN